jgi:CheY-like chemotaxis protein
VIGQDRPDVLASDIAMPDQAGYDPVRVVRADPATKTHSVAALTAFARTKDRKRSLLAGAHAHVAKPVVPAGLRAVAASLASCIGKRDQHQGGEPWTPRRFAS